MSAAGVARKGYIPVAGEWYPAIVYPYPKVYHKYLKAQAFQELYPDIEEDNTNDQQDDQNQETNTNTNTNPQQQQDPVNDPKDLEEDLSGL